MYRKRINISGAKILAVAGIISSAVVTLAGLLESTFGVGIGAGVMFVGNIWVLFKKEKKHD